VKRRFRLRRESDFQRALKGRRVFSGEAFVALARPRPEGEWRIGVAVSRQLKGSVRRNRARRRLREAARTQIIEQDWPPEERGIPYDVVLIARPAALLLPAAALQREAREVRSRLSAAERRPDSLESTRS
jgi:ribonuclease P protein component